MGAQPGAATPAPLERLFAIVWQNLEEVGGKLSAALRVVLRSRRWAAVWEQLLAGKPGQQRQGSHSALCAADSKGSRGKGS